jgi:hypothetical protein
MTRAEEKSQVAEKEEVPQKAGPIEAKRFFTGTTLYRSSRDFESASDITRGPLPSRNTEQPRGLRQAASLILYNNVDKTEWSDI